MPPARYVWMAASMSRLLESEASSTSMVRPMVAVEIGLAVGRLMSDGGAGISVRDTGAGPATISPLSWGEERNDFRVGVVTGVVVDDVSRFSALILSKVARAEVCS